VESLKPGLESKQAWNGNWAAERALKKTPRQLGPPSSDTGGKRESSDLPRHPEYPQQQRQPSNIGKLTSYTALRLFALDPVSHLVSLPPGPDSRRKKMPQRRLLLAPLSPAAPSLIKVLMSIIPTEQRGRQLSAR